MKTAIILGLNGRIAAWAVFGTLLGLVIALFVPNLKLMRGSVGGAIGGVIGAIGFDFSRNLYGYVTGRLLGAAIIRFFIGLMIVFAEIILREAWLEISYGDDKKTVTIGVDPIYVGSDSRLCNLIVGQARPLEMSFTSNSRGIFVEIYDESLNNFTSPIAIQKGQAWRVGGATLMVLGR